MKLLSEFFGEAQCYFITKNYGITKLEDAQRLTDEQLLKCRNVGELTVSRFRDKFPSITPEPKIPMRGWCAMCNQPIRVSFWVPDEIWYEAIHPSLNNSTICLNCFVIRADEKLLAWDKDIKFYPMSMYEQMKIIKSTS